MCKALKRYRFIVGILILVLGLLLIVNFNFKVKVDRLRLLNEKVLNSENEFKNAKENRFIQFKNDLLDKDIVLDNIVIGSEEGVKFEIHKSMYPEQINDFIKFLNDKSYLRIIEMSIIKNNFDYSVNISAEI